MWEDMPPPRWMMDLSTWAVERRFAGLGSLGCSQLHHIERLSFSSLEGVTLVSTWSCESPS